MTWKEIIYKLLKLGIICFTIGYLTYLFVSRVPVITNYYGQYYEGQRSTIKDTGRKIK